jgi:YegS/Rv2252/BmrU family lipid kinase
LSSIAFIVNPRAGNGSTGLKWPAIKASARNRLGSFKSYVTTGPGEAKYFAREAIASGAKLVVCVGGDGTLNEVVNGFMEIGESERSGLSLGYVPGGTGCDFIKTVSIPKDMEEAIDLMATGTERSIDLGSLFYKDHDGRDCRRYFLNITSFGLGGEVDQRVNRTTKAFGPFISFIWATLISILLYGKKQIRLKVDQGFEQEIIIWNVVVANGQYHGGGMWVAPEASVDDGFFDITVIGDLSLPEVFLNLPKLYNGKIKNIDKVITLTGKKIEALSDQKVLLDVDGEQPGMLPVVIDIVPGAIKIIEAQ